MKRLSLLRHAKSSWDDPVERDFDRPLNGRGRRAAHRMGQFLHDEGMAFDLIVASPALRIKQTVEGLEAGLGARMACQWDRRIYMASSVILMDLVQETDDAVGHLLLIGHNPGLEDLALNASIGHESPARAAVAEKYPTAAYAALEFPVARWAAVREGGGTITRFVRPRDLDPALGPDD